MCFYRAQTSSHVWVCVEYAGFEIWLSLFVADKEKMFREETRKKTQLKKMSDVHYHAHSIKKSSGCVS